jgi:hypothetical protein
LFSSLKNHKSIGEKADNKNMPGRREESEAENILHEYPLYSTIDESTLNAQKRRK